MKKKDRKDEKVYYSMIEFEKKFLPNLFKKKLEEKRSKDPHVSGTGLVADLLDDVRRQLAK